MDNETYIENVLKTKSSHFDPTSMDPDLIHAAFGLVTESGEILDIVKQAFFYGKGREGVDIAHVKEELGDLFWYLGVACANLDVSFDEIMEANINKLRTRYPGKFSTENAYNRNLEAEKQALK